LNLFRSNGGIELFGEVSLLIAEHVIEEDPYAVRSLLLLSKSFHSLLKRYEISCTKHLSYNEIRLAYTNSAQAIILSSQVAPRDNPVQALTYPWFSELRFRSTIIDFLTNHEITHMEDYTNDWPTLDIPKSELQQRLVMFKRKAFLLLYRLADCAVGLDGTGNIRARQSVFLDSLSTQDLATLGVMVEVMGQSFFNMTKRLLLSPDFQNSDALLPSISSATYFHSPSSMQYNDSINDNCIRECMCVFEDLIQRHGPYFAWAYLAGSEDKTRRPDLWARAELKQGLDDMNAFELGYTMAFASLQSVVWRIFCKKANCSLPESWISAKEMVENKMTGYKIA